MEVDAGQGQGIGTWGGRCWVARGARWMLDIGGRVHWGKTV
jgi:hypothetical protein